MGYRINSFKVLMRMWLLSPMPCLKTSNAAVCRSGIFIFLFDTDVLQAFGISAFDENTGEPSDRGNWDLNICCTFYKIKQGKQK